MLDQKTRTCKKCGATKLLEDFASYAEGKRRYECQPCNRKRMQATYDRYRDKYKERARRQYAADPSAHWTPERRQRANENAKRQNRILRDEVYAAYGGECVACGENEPMFLTMDHVNNDGMLMRREVHSPGSSNIYRWIKRNGYPATFQILCMNCNFGKARNGGVLVRDRRLSSERSTTIPKGSTAKWPEVQGSKQAAATLDDDIV